MIVVTFPDLATEKRALAFLLGRFSGCVLRSGEHLVPAATLEALASQNISFTVKGKATLDESGDSLADDLLQSNPEFQAMVAKSKAGPRKPFPPAK
jgi:hypothetical protein